MTPLGVLGRTRDTVACVESSSKIHPWSCLVAAAGNCCSDRQEGDQVFAGREETVLERLLAIIDTRRDLGSWIVIVA